MKILTKYKDGKFLLNHSSMNEAIEKFGGMFKSGFGED